jgi:hypothetical protein
MTQSVCTYSGDRDEALVTFLYDKDASGEGERAAFGAHLPTCAACRDELDTLRGIRTQLATWNPPEPNFAITFGGARQSRSLDRPSSISNQQSAINNQHLRWWRSVPAWAQVAAALLFLGVSAAIANLDVRYDQQGLSIRTGWSQQRDARGATATNRATASSPAAAGSGEAPWKADLTALEQQLKAEMRVARTSPDAATPQAQTVSTHATDAELVRRVRALVDESEKRQQRELALRVAELLRDVNAQRQGDLAKVNRALGAVENNLGVEVLKTRQQVNLMYRASQVR